MENLNSYIFTQHHFGAIMKLIYIVITVRELFPSVLASFSTHFTRRSDAACKCNKYERAHLCNWQQNQLLQQIARHISACRRISFIISYFVLFITWNLCTLLFVSNGMWASAFMYAMACAQQCRRPHLHTQTYTHTHERLLTLVWILCVRSHLEISQSNTQLATYVNRLKVCNCSANMLRSLARNNLRLTLRWRHWRCNIELRQGV